MKLRLVVLAVLVIGAAISLGAPAFAEEGLPDLPGLEQAGKVSGAGSGNLPVVGSGGAASAGTKVPAPAAPRRTATRPAASARDTLPATGAPVAGFALLGVAFVSAGRMLVEIGRR